MFAAMISTLYSGVLMSIAILVGCSGQNYLRLQTCRDFDDEIDSAMKSLVLDRLKNGLMERSAQWEEDDKAYLHALDGRSGAKAAPPVEAIDSNMYVSSAACWNSVNSMNCDMYHIAEIKKSYHYNDNQVPVISNLIAVLMTDDSESRWALVVVSRVGEGNWGVFHRDRESLRCYAQKPTAAELGTFIRDQRALESMLIQPPDSVAQQYYIRLNFESIEVCRSNTEELFGHVPDVLED